MIRTIAPGVARGSVRVPGSKSYTHRALALAFVAGAPLTIAHPLDAEDTRATAAALQRLGARVTCWASAWHVRPPSGSSTRRTTIDCRESGTTLRLMTALAATEHRPVRFVGRGRLPLRPISALLRPLESLGARIRYEANEYALPYTIEGPIQPGRVRVATEDSSQPVSGLLLALARLEGVSELAFEGPIASRPYIDATVAWMRSRSVRLRARGRGFEVRGPAPRRGGRVEIPADASSAAYAWAAAAVSGGAVTVGRYDERWPQADARVLDVLQRAGVMVDRRGGGVRTTGRARRGIRADLTDAPDLVPLVACLAVTIPGARSVLRVPPNLRHKESDRLAGTIDLVRAFGGSAQARSGSLRIVGASELGPIALTDLSDHRMVMSAAIGALAATGPSRIGRSEVVRKSFPGFWRMLEALLS
ncbi:MAG: 3-phosphoshikimate 1-carboxyvinyltransferase [Thermoplasmata archaeon]